MSTEQAQEQQVLPVGSSCSPQRPLFRIGITGTLKCLIDRSGEVSYVRNCY